LSHTHPTYSFQIETWLSSASSLPSLVSSFCGYWKNRLHVTSSLSKTASNGVSIFSLASLANTDTKTRFISTTPAENVATVEHRLRHRLVAPRFNSPSQEAS